MRTSGRTSKRLTINQKYSLTGWGFLAPAAILICVMNFYPMVQALILSFQTGIGNNLKFGGFSNYARLLKDPVFTTALVNNFVYLIIQLPIMLVLALIWRWTGYNMVFYLAGLQNIDDSLYEAAKIDGASAVQSFFKITVPMLKPTILLTTIMSTNGTLQLFDESVNLTGGGPANSTLTMSHYIYKASFEYNPQFGYAAAMSYVIFVLVAILAFVQMKVGDKR